MRVLVCGGREFGDVQLLYRTLDRLHLEKPIDVLIEGGARGADQFARGWARFRHVPVLTFEADWARFGRAAGMHQNRQMLDEGKPHFVIAFPGGPGTRDMVRQANAIGMLVVSIPPDAA